MNKLLVLFFIGLVVCIPQNEERDLEATGSDTDTTTTPSGTGTTEPPPTETTTTPVVTTTTKPEVTTPENTGTEEEKTCGHMDKDEWTYEVDTGNKNATIAYKDEYKVYFKVEEEEVEVDVTLIKKYNSEHKSGDIGFMIENGKDSEMIKKKLGKTVTLRDVLDSRYLQKLNSTIDNGVAFEGVEEEIDTVFFNSIYNSEKVSCFTVGKYIDYDAAYGVVPAIFTLFLILIALF